MKRTTLCILAGVIAMTLLFTGCAYTAPYRETALARGGRLPPDHPALIGFGDLEVFMVRETAFRTRD